MSFIRILFLFTFHFLALSLINYVTYKLWLQNIPQRELAIWIKRFLMISPLALGLTAIFVVMGGRLPILETSARWFTFFAYAFLGYMFVLASGVVTIRILTHIPLKQLDIDESRRQFLLFQLGAGAFVASTAASLYGAHRALSRPSTPTVNVPILPVGSPFKDLRIVQISDLHVGVSIRKSFVETVVETANSLKPDMIFLTGDFVDGTVEDLLEEILPLKNLQAPMGIYYVPGNHEYYSGVEPWLKTFQDFGFRVLRNSNHSLEKRGHKLQIAGVDDWGSPRFGVEGSNLDKALATLDKNSTTLLLAHQPREVERAIEMGVNYQLSGHTHGGQIWPFGYITGLIFRYLKGLYPVGKGYIYVSCGTGFWGPALRVAAPSEITLHILKEV